jgi:hypothetical protein
MSYAPLAQRGFIFPQPVYDLFTVSRPAFSLTPLKYYARRVPLATNPLRQGGTIARI